jgi:uncharacterized membrane protein
MNKIILSLALSVLCVLGVNAQSAGDWYLGTGDIANKAWTEWSIAPTVGYGLTDDLMVGVNISQADSTVDVSYDLHARYYVRGYFVYATTDGLNTEALKVGVGRMFGIHKGIYVDPKVVYDTQSKTTNLTLGLGLYF